MSAASDYQQAVHMLSRPLPAYVTYVQGGHLKMDAIEKSMNETVTVRTRDGKTVKGKGLDIMISADHKTTGNILTNSPFDPACYTAVSAHTLPFDGRDAEAITLKDVCSHDKDDGDFQTLYVDPGSRQPLAAMGGNSDQSVVVHIEQRFARVSDYVLPSLLEIRVKGSGLMFWLDVDAHIAFTGYTFSNTFP